MARKSGEKKRRVVSFELEAEMLQVLEQEAKAYSAKSRHVRARDIVVQSLCDKSGSDLAQLVAELDAKVAWLKIAIQKIAYVIFVYGSHTDPKSANSWIREHLN